MLDEYVAIGLEKGLNVLVKQVDGVLHAEQLDDDFNSELTNRPSMQPTLVNFNMNYKADIFRLVNMLFNC